MDASKMQIELQIVKKISEFFNWINHPIVQNYFIQDLQNWDALCASLHIINDLQRPKREYYSLKSINHLETIGIMQTLYIEQDSIWTLKNSILKTKINTFSLPKYEKVRSIRNEVFGHPSDKSAGKDKTRHFFDIEDESRQLIKHIYWGSIKEIESDSFNIPDLVSENSRITFSYLEELEQDLKLIFKKIMSNYSINFGELFKHTSYTFEKLLTKENDDIGIKTYHTIDEDISRVQEGLIERNILDDFERQIEVLKFLSNKLKSLFHEQTYKDIEFYTYASTLRENIRKLQIELKETDKIFE